MNTEPLHRRLSAHEYSVMFDAARARALQARSEAIDEFWAAAGRAIVAAWQAIRREWAQLHARRAPRA